MLTINDIKKLTAVFATKQKLAEMEERLASKEELREVMTKVDAVFGEVKAMREDQSMHYLQHEDNDNEHKVFRKRLNVIESVPVIAHQIKRK